MSVASFGLGTIRSTLYLDTQQYKMALQQATGMTRQAVAKNNKILALQSGSANVGMAAAMGATIVAPMFAMVNKIQKVYEEYDKVLGKIQTVSKASAQEMKILNKVFLENGKAFGETPTNMAKAGYVSAQALFTTFKEMKKVAEASAQLRLASGGEITTEKSAESLTTMLNAFGMGADKLKELNEVLLVTRDVGATSMDKLAESVGNVAAAFAQAFQGKDRMSTFKDMMALLASGTQAGMDPSVMATGMRSMIARTYTESERPKSPLNALAMSKGFKNANAMMRPGIIPFLKILKDATGGHLELLAALGYERREMSGVAAVLRKGMENTVIARNAIENSTGAVELASARMKQTWWYVKNVFASVKESASIAFGPAVIKLLTQMAEAMLGIFEYFAKLPEATKEFIVLAGAVTTLRVAIAGLGGALQIMGIRWASIIPGMSLMLGMLSGKGGIGKGIGGAKGSNPNLSLLPYTASLPLAHYQFLKVQKAKKALGKGSISSMVKPYAGHFDDVDSISTYRVPFKGRPSDVLRSRIGAGAMSSLWGFQNLLALRNRSKATWPGANMSARNPWEGLTANRGKGGSNLSSAIMALYLQLTGLRRNLSSVQNKPTKGFGWDTMQSWRASAFGNRALSSGAMSGTPTSNAVAGRGLGSMSAMLGASMTQIGSTLVAVWRKITLTIVGFATTAYSAIALGSRNTVTAISNLWKTSIIPLLSAGAGAGVSAGKTALNSAGSVGAGIWASLTLFGSWIGVIALKLASLATYLGLAILAFAGLAGFWTSIKNNFVAPDFSFTDMFTDLWESLSRAGGWLVLSFNQVAEGLVMAAREWLFGWSREDAEKAFTENYNKAKEEWYPDPKSYEGPAQYFKQVIDGMVQKMSPTGTMEGLSDEDREKVMREILTPKHKFLMDGEGGPFGRNKIQFKKAALSMDEAMTLFPELFEGPGYSTPETTTPPQAKAEGVPQFAEEVKIKLGEIAEAFTLGSAEAWKAIVPRYYVEEKSLKNQKEQLKLSKDLITVTEEVVDNTARIGTGGTLALGNLG